MYNVKRDIPYNNTYVISNENSTTIQNCKLSSNKMMPMFVVECFEESSISYQSVTPFF